MVLVAPVAGDDDGRGDNGELECEHGLDMLARPQGIPSATWSSC